MDYPATEWYRASTLTERITSLRALQADVNINNKLTNRREQRWRSQAPFTDNTYFAQRLSINNISEEEFLHILGESDEAVEKRFSQRPEWLEQLMKAFESYTYSQVKPLSVKGMRSQEVAAFSGIVEPLMAQARKQIRERIQGLTDKANRENRFLPFDIGTIEDILFSNLPGQMLRMLSRTLVLELHIARLQGGLKGDTSEEKFQSFVERIQQPQVAVSILKDYPVLARQVTIRLQQWVKVNFDFVRRLVEDWQKIRITFCPETEPGKLVSLEGDVGDSHQGGSSVMIAAFDSGFKLVYKPRPLTVDLHFQELLEWLNHRGNHPPFKTLKILGCDNYGWVEFISAEGCASLEEVRRFYERQGGYLALLYALEATDFHFENLIASGEHPVLIDLEALFHPRPEDMTRGASPQAAAVTIQNSVMRVGLLPQRIWADADFEGIDLSGLGAKAGQLTPREVSEWQDVGKEEMRLIRRRVEMPGGQNKPTLQGTEIDIQEHMESVVDGFTAMYQLLLKHRDELLGYQGPLECFAEDDVRVIFRPTQFYALMLQGSFHPDLLRHGLDRDRWFDRLWLGIETAPYLAKIISAECEELHNGDIPIFTTKPSSCTLWNGLHQPIFKFFEEPGMALVQRRIRGLSKADLSRQIWFIRASYATLSTVNERTPQTLTYTPDRTRKPANTHRLLTAARALGDQLLSLSLRDDDEAAWIGVALTHDLRWSLAPLSMDLYGGVSGISLFLGYLGAITGDTRYTNLAKAGVKTVQRQVEQMQSEQYTAIGAFTGWGGVIYTLAHLGTLWQQLELVSQSESLAQQISDLIEQDEALDIVSGSAGCLASLLALYHCAPSEKTLNVALKCGERLLSQAQPMAKGIGWMTLAAETEPLTGFSHGGAGVAWALLELSTITGDSRFQTGALLAMDYERSLFCSKAENWPDLRQFESTIRGENNSDVSCATAWCHGAPGIGLGRLRSLRHLNEADKNTAIRTEINVALQTTLKQGLGQNHSLCHGDMGNLELLLQAGRLLNQPEWVNDARRIATVVLDSVEQKGWLCGSPLGVESPDFMTGLAGIGYGLLRLAKPDRVPSVLTLEAPVLERAT